MIWAFVIVASSGLWAYLLEVLLVRFFERQKPNKLGIARPDEIRKRRHERKGT